jgi:hypothetical protein
VNNWKIPGDAEKMPLSDNLSRDILTVQCHSHNDYWRKVPLFNALAAGCISVEADIWKGRGPDNTPTDDLFVGHSLKSLRADRTLKTLYIDPLIYVLEYKNKDSGPGSAVGVFDTAINQTLVLLLDFKTGGSETWPLVQEQLQPLRDRGWLTKWNSTSNSRNLAPITVVATGEAPFDLILQLPTHDVFFDAPLEQLDKTNNYTAANSYFASVSMGKAIGKVSSGGLTGGQIATVKNQAVAALEKSLLSRYWDTPSWPLSKRNKVWEALSDQGVGLLNVDSLETATRWDWRWCTVAGLNLCV